MTVLTREDAWELADVLFPWDYEEDPISSQNAGYPIYRAITRDVYAWISDLGSVLELNLPGGVTRRINIGKPDTTKEMQKLLIGYLQSQMDDYQKNASIYGSDDRIVRKKADAMIACKEMAEALIRMPVNLQKNGNVTVG